MLGLLLCILRSIPFIGKFFREDFESLPPVPQKPLKRRRKIAIIGCGVGGATAAYFLRETLGELAELHVFGDSKIGGRTGVVEFAGKKYESGASIIHKKNRYMSGLSAKFGLQKSDLPGEYFGIFDGVKFVIRSSAYSIVTTIKMLLRYGLGIRKINSYIDQIFPTFLSIYDLQGKGQSYADPAAMMKAMGDGSLYQASQVTAEEHFVNDLGWGPLVVNELVESACRVNYGQDVRDVTALVGFTSITGMQGGSLYSIVGGNYLLPVKLLEASKAEMHQVHVTKVVRKAGTADDDAPSYILRYKEDDATGQSELWDSVIVACPLETNEIEFVGFDNQDSWNKMKKQKFQRTVANFVHGRLNPRFFGEDRIDQCFPQEILTTRLDKPTVDFRSVGMQCPVELTTQQRKEFAQNSALSAAKGEKQVYKVFTTEPLTSDQLNGLFSECEDHVYVDWMAYPLYESPEHFAPFVLDTGLFYINSIERMCSAMEMSCIGGRNASLLMSEYLHSLDEEHDST